MVDNSTIIYDSKRDRLLIVRKMYGDKAPSTADLHTLDLNTRDVGKLIAAGNAAAAAAIPYLCQLRYDAAARLVLAGCTLPPDDDGLRRTPGLRLRRQPLDLLEDHRRRPQRQEAAMFARHDLRRQAQLFWAVDTKSNVFVLRLDPEKADVRPLE